MDQLTRLRGLYLELLKSAISYALYRRDEGAPPSERELEAAVKALERASDKYMDLAAETGDADACRMLCSPPEEVVELQRSNTPMSHALTARSGFDNLQRCVETVLAERVPGDFMECGVWRGGLCVFMTGMLQAWGDVDRRVWVADSFEGLPPPDPATCLKDAIAHEMLAEIGYLGICLDEVKETFDRYGLLHDRVRFVQGWFDRTLPTVPVEQLAILRIDADYYESTVPCLEHLYPKLSVGGFLILDDYGLPLGERRAVDEYRAAHGISDELTQVNVQEYFWRKAR